MDPRFDAAKRERARKLYEGGMTVREVADEIGVAVSRAHALLTEAGTSMRARGPRKEEQSDESEPEKADAA
jgi:orotate phosphoribosyltransferase-like protein